MTDDEPTPDDVICGNCHGFNLEQTNKDRDSLAWYYDYQCQDCGANGQVENRHSGISKYHRDVTTPRRVDLEREAAHARDRGGHA